VSERGFAFFSIVLETVRLEVAMVEGRELYGWPGSNRIGEANLDRLIGS